MYPVAIIGGGPVGLATSIALSQHGIPHVLFERHPGTSIHQGAGPEPAQRRVPALVGRGR